MHICVFNKEDTCIFMCDLIRWVAAYLCVIVIRRVRAYFKVCWKRLL